MVTWYWQSPTRPCCRSPWPSSPTRGARLVNWQQDLYPEVAEALRGESLPVGRKTLLQRLRNHSLARARRTIVISHGMRRHLLRQGVDASPLVVIPNWTDVRAIRPLAPASNPLRRAWCDDAAFVVGYSGNLGRAHEIDTLLAAMVRLGSVRNILFLFIGHGIGMAELERRVSATGLMNVRFLPPQPRGQLALSLSVPDCHLVSLRPALEGLILPSKLYGAAASGRPVVFIGDPCGECGSLIRSTEIGRVIETGDGPSLAAALLGLARQQATMALFGARARALAEARFGADWALARLEATLRAVASESDCFNGRF